MITYLLMGLNVLVFLLMCVWGIHPFNPQISAIFDWGGVTAKAIVEGEWWRLFSYMFIHIGAVHLLANMYALFMVGRNLERFIGKWLFILTYIVTGVFAGLISFLGHKNTMVVSAGASGAIAGVFGAFFVLLLTPIIDKAVRFNMLKQMGIILAINVSYGLSNGGGIDHYAHIGGLLSGAFIGGLLALFYYVAFRRPAARTKLLRIVAALPLVLLLVISPVIIKTNSDKSYYRFLEMAQTLDLYQEEFDENWGEIDFKGPLEVVTARMREVVLPEVERTVGLTHKFNQLELQGGAVELCEDLKRFISLRNERLLLFLKAYEEEDDRYFSDLERLNQELECLIEKIDGAHH